MMYWLYCMYCVFSTLKVITFINHVDLPRNILRTTIISKLINSLFFIPLKRPVQQTKSPSPIIFTLQPTLIELTHGIQQMHQ